MLVTNIETVNEELIKELFFLLPVNESKYFLF